MDTNKKILIGSIGALVVAGGVAIGLILSKTPEKADLSTIHTEAATKAPRETLPPPSTEAPTTQAPEETKENASSVSVSLDTYTSGKISIQYPVVSQMEDASKETKINELLKSNALSVIKAHDLDEEKDSLEIKCKVISADRKRITVTYSGILTAENAAQPLNLFFSNTLDLLQVQNMGLSDFTDAYTMAGYVLSEDVTFYNTTAESEIAAREYFQKDLSMDKLTLIFDGADFPLDKEGSWPSSFSYEKQGTIYFSVPVPHALGDYVIVSFDPSTK